MAIYDDFKIENDHTINNMINKHKKRISLRQRVKILEEKVDRLTAKF